MKYLLVWCEDRTPSTREVVSLVEGARLPHLQQLAQAGAAGLIHPSTRLRPIYRFQIQRGLLGFGLHEHEPAPGSCYAGSAGVSIPPEHTVWSCELVTQRDGRLIDPQAGGISTKESHILIQALNEQLGSPSRRWIVGEGTHHLLMLADPEGHIDAAWRTVPPDLLAGRVWKRHLPKGPLGQFLRTLMETCAELLDDHPINRVRADLGENPANLLWCWGGGIPRRTKSFSERTGLSGAVVSSNFMMRGFANLCGLHWERGTDSYSEDALQHFIGRLDDLLKTYDLLYLHLPITSHDPVERLCVMERLDQLVFKPLAQRVRAQQGGGRYLVAVDDRRTGATPFIAEGTGLARHPVAQLTTEACAKSPLSCTDSATVFSWFVERGTAP